MSESTSTGAASPSVHPSDREGALPPAVRAEYPYDGQLLTHPEGTVSAGITQHFLDLPPTGEAVLDPDGQPATLLFVHGNPTWSFYWRTLVRPFNDRYRCVVVDHVGCGLSDKPQGWSYRLPDHIDNLHRIVEHLDLRHVTLFVHDWGGPIGLGTALKAPERYARFVVFNTLAKFGEFPLSIKSCRWPVVGPLAVRGGNAFLRFALSKGTTHPERFTGAVRDGYLFPYGSWADRVAIQRFVDDIPVEPHHPNQVMKGVLEEGIPTLADRPATVIWGNDDFVFHHGFRDDWPAVWPDAETHFLDDANHFVVEDAHERIVPLVEGFLARHRFG